MTHNTEQIVNRASAYLSSRNDVLFAYLFGSHAKGSVTPMSDIDIAVYTADESCTADTKMDMLHALSSTLQTERIDLVILNSAPITLAFKVLENHVVLVDRDSLKRHAFESLTMRKYFDFSLLEKRILERRFFNA